MKTIRIGLVLTGVVLLLASAASASNMAFALRLQLGGAAQELRFVALPYQYAPTTAEGLCADLGGTAAVAEVVRWDEATSQLVAHPCGTGTEDFPLAEGMAYGVRSAVGAAIDGLLVGTHDPAFAFSIAATAGSSLSFVSLPYHAAIAARGGTAGVVDQGAGAYAAHVCGSVFDEGFPLTVGEGYGLANAEGQAISWTPEHY